MSDDGGNGSASETDEERRWREHAERFDAVRALERRLASLDMTMAAGFKDMDVKQNLVLQGINGMREDLQKLYEHLIRLTSAQIITDERIASLETRPVRSPRRKK